MFARKEDSEKDDPERDVGTAEFAEGEAVPVMGHGLAQKKTLPLSLIHISVIFLRKNVPVSPSELGKKVGT